VAQADTKTITIVLDFRNPATGEVELDQPVDLQETGVLSSSTLEEAYDRLNMQIRRVWRKAQDVLTFSTDEGGTGSTGTADTLVGFDGSGDLGEIPNSKFCETANNLSDVDAATARTNLDVDQSGTRFALSELTDSTITTPSSGELLSWNGSAWVNTGTDAVGGMLQSVYDPTAVAGDAFDSANHAYTPDGTNAVATAVETKLRESISVKDFGAVGDGVADDTTAIQRALNHAKSLGGGEVRIPAGTYNISTTLSISDAAGVTLVGDGGGHMTTTEVGSSTILDWVGGTSVGTMFVIKSTQTAVPKTTSCGIKGVHFKCNNVVNTCIRMTSVAKCFLDDVTINKATYRGLAMGCQDDTIGADGKFSPADNQACNFDNLSFYQETGACIFLDGNNGADSAVGANTSLCRFGQVQMNIRDSTQGFVFGYSDANVLDYLRIFHYGTSPNDKGLVFKADKTNKQRHSRYNVVTFAQTAFSGCTAEAGLTNAGDFIIGENYTIRTVGTTDFTLIGASSNTVGEVFTATGVGTGSGVAGIVGLGASANNSILHYSTGNNSINNMPVIEEGATLSYNTSRTQVGFAAPTVAVNDSTPELLEVFAQDELDNLGSESLRIVSKSSNHARLSDDNGNEWKVAIGRTSGNFLIESVSTVDSDSLISMSVGGNQGFIVRDDLVWSRLPHKLQTYTVATLPPNVSGTLGTKGAMIYVSNESGGAVTAFSDGTNWRRTTDRAIVS
jgi:hypothetical protein